MTPRALLVLLVLAAVVAAGAGGDPDRDGVATATELRAGTGPLVPDTDGDGLVDGRERGLGTDPRAPDTDGDGLTDGMEVETGTDPTAVDTDGDGLGDGREREAGTDPLVVDTDGDGLGDAEELAGGSSPTAADTDGDGLDDAEERSAGTDPAVADSDGDGVADAEELAGGTDPREADTDGDGLDDGRERALGTDPTAADTDGDGLVDGAEVEAGADPHVVDTDGDGFGDGVEVHRGDVLPGADPTRIDVYVEVDAVGDARLPENESERLVDAFGDAPVGPNGSRGIRLHVHHNETGLPDRGPVKVADRPGGGTTLGAYAAEHRQLDGYGYHYLLVVPEVLDVAGSGVVGEAGDGVLVVEASPVAGATGSTVMHELAHSLGLDADDFDGIDSNAYRFREYPSVMNYRAPATYYALSDGPPHDDWAALVEGLYVPDTSRLEPAEGAAASRQPSAWAKTNSRRSFPARAGA